MGGGTGSDCWSPWGSTLRHGEGASTLRSGAPAVGCAGGAHCGECSGPVAYPGDAPTLPHMPRGRGLTRFRMLALSRMASSLKKEMGGLCFLEVCVRMRAAFVRLVAG